MLASTQMFLHNQSLYPILFAKLRVGLVRACLADSNDIKFVKFGRVDPKIQGFENGK